MGGLVVHMNEIFTRVVDCGHIAACMSFAEHRTCVLLNIATKNRYSFQRPPTV